MSRRAATNTLQQPEKDRRLGEQLIAAAQQVPNSVWSYDFVQD
ncbi:hypothetical protein BamMEX5DRAFT_0356 [Burkholderia ambifaria MEX-5]|uniref:Uncharacterized protein n=1 Tax=Burkholderia ambifaria MEX-5 TaxID=396597 RepID=B1SXU0_9BURK|nr:hypothetical protein BamMEX5DRAFT_0356 [Burkholderia ambifaria MEX-5]